MRDRRPRAPGRARRGGRARPEHRLAIDLGGGAASVVLGRGANEDAVIHWLKQGAGVPGYIGFAIGQGSQHHSPAHPQRITGHLAEFNVAALGNLLYAVGH